MFCGHTQIPYIANRRSPLKWLKWSSMESTLLGDGSKGFHFFPICHHHFCLFLSEHLKFILSCIFVFIFLKQPSQSFRKILHVASIHLYWKPTHAHRWLWPLSYDRMCAMERALGEQTIGLWEAKIRFLCFATARAPVKWREIWTSAASVVLSLPCTSFLLKSKIQVTVFRKKES